MQPALKNINNIYTYIYFLTDPGYDSACLAGSRRMEMFYILNHWHWWAMASLWLIAELLAPCYYFLAISVAGLVTGFAARFAPDLPGLWQLGLFAAVCLITLGIAHKMRQNRTQAQATEPRSK